MSAISFVLTRGPAGRLAEGATTAARRPGAPDILAGMLEHYVALSRYNSWMNGRLYSLAAALDDVTRRRDLGAFFGSIHATFHHILVTDWMWLKRFTGDPTRFQLIGHSGVSFPSELLERDFALLQSERKRTDAAIEAWASGRDESALHAPFDPSSTGSSGHVAPVWWAATQMFNHQTHHRGQITTLLKQLGDDPGVTDFWVFMHSE